MALRPSPSTSLGVILFAKSPKGKVLFAFLDHIDCRIYVICNFHYLVEVQSLGHVRGGIEMNLGGQRNFQKGDATIIFLNFMWKYHSICFYHSNFFTKVFLQKTFLFIIDHCLKKSNIEQQKTTTIIITMIPSLVPIIWASILICQQLI